MSIRPALLVGTAAAVVLTTATAGVSVAGTSAAVHHHHHHHHVRYVTSGVAYGTRIQAHHLAGSGKSARNALRCGATHKSRVSDTAQANLGSLGLARAVRTRSLTVPNAKGKVKTIERARTARVSLLNNLITVRAIRATAVAHPRKANATKGSSEFLGLRIGGKLYPANIKPNTSLTIPGLVQLTLNAQHRTSPHGVHSISVDALRLKLLKGSGFGPLGTTAIVGQAVATSHPHHKSLLRGASSGTEVHVGSLVTSHPTFQTKMPCGAKHGKVVRHKGVGVDLGRLLRTRAIRTKATGHQNTGDHNARHQNRPSMARTQSTVARVNLLNGLIKVKALKALSVAHLANGRLSTKGSGSKFLGLTINGKHVPINAKPNTAINLLGIGTLWLNKFVPSAKGLTVHGLELVLGHARAGLPAGTVIDVANARANVRH